MSGVLSESVLKCKELNFDSGHVDFKCWKMYSWLEELCFRRREADCIRKQIKDYQESQDLRREWIARKIDNEDRLEQQFEEFGEMIEREYEKLHYNWEEQENIKSAMEEFLEFYRVILLDQGKFVDEADKNCKHQRLIEARYEKYRNKKRPIRMGLRKCKVIKCYF